MARKKQRHGRQSATPATRAAAQAGVAFTTHAYEHDPSAGSYGEEAAQCLGVPPGRVFKTLVTDVDGAPTVAIIPVSAALDLKALATSAHGKRATMTDPTVAERVTGYVRGGISPLGQRRQLPTVLDTAAREHQTVYVSAGRRGLEIELAPADLAALTGATVAPVTRT